MKIIADLREIVSPRGLQTMPPVTQALRPTILTTGLSTIRSLRTPLLLLLGRHDINVSSQVAAEWFARVRAPSKRRCGSNDRGIT